MAVRLETYPGARQQSVYLWCDSIADLAAHSVGNQTSRPSWRFGSLGSREATVEHVLAGKATPSQRARFDQECGKWQDAKRKLADALPSRRRRLRHREAGDVVDVGRWLADRPDCWETLERGRSMPSVTVGFNVALSCGNAEAEFTSTVAQAAACCWALCEAGYAVRIVGCILSKHCDGTRFEFCGPAWIAKDWQTPLDVERLLSYGHPGLLRDCTFGLWESEVGAKSPWGSAGLPGEKQARELGVDLFLGRSWVTAGSEAGAQLIERTEMQGFFQR